jgi:hypothetical protein
VGVVDVVVVVVEGAVVEVEELVVVGRSEVVVGLDVDVVAPVVVVLPCGFVVTTDVVVVGAVVVAASVVVVGGGCGGGHSETSGSGWPTSKAITTERNWPSWNESPMCTSSPGPTRELTDTLIGFCPVCSRSASPGLLTYLQTNTLSEGLSPLATCAPHAVSRRSRT